MARNLNAPRNFDRAIVLSKSIIEQYMNNTDLDLPRIIYPFMKPVLIYIFRETRVVHAKA